MSLLRSFSQRHDRNPGLVQLAIHRDGGWFDLPLVNYPIDEYISTLVYLALKDLADSKWSMIYGTGSNKWTHCDIDEFSAHMGFIIPSSYLTKAWEDYMQLCEEIRKHWNRLDQPDVYLPVVVTMEGCYYVIEISFAV